LKSNEKGKKGNKKPIDVPKGENTTIDEREYVDKKLKVDISNRQGRKKKRKRAWYHRSTNGYS